MQSLHTRYRPVGIVNRGLAARGGKAAQNQRKQKDSECSHNCGLSFLAMRRPCSYQNQLSWQVIFLCSGDLFCQRHLSADPIPNFPTLVHEFRSLANSRICCDAPPDFDINHPRKYVLIALVRSARILCPAKKFRLGLDDIISQGARVSRNYKRSETGDIQVKDDLEKIRTPGRVGGVILRGETAPPQAPQPRGNSSGFAVSPADGTRAATAP
jgi:hypothetical protein